MSFAISAPYPATKVTTILPDPRFGNSRAVESAIQTKRTMNGKLWTYAKPQSSYELTFTFMITRSKDLELGEFIRVYKAARWKLVDHDGVQWEAALVGEPVRRTVRGRQGAVSASTGGEFIEVSLRFSATKL